MATTEIADVAVAAPARTDAEAVKARTDSFASSTATTALLLVPGAMTVVLSFNSGSFFPGTTALGAVVMAAVAACALVFARRTFEGLSAGTVVAAGALALFAGWTILSSHWSHAPGRALLSYDRVLMYVLTLAVFGSMARSEARVRTLVYGIAAGAAIVCIGALAAHCHLIHAVPSRNPDRISYPLTYWNTLGLLAGVGLLLCGHIACSLRDHWPARILGAAACPLLATTLFLTFSRGATWAAIAGVLAYLAIARPPGVLAAAVSTLPPTVIAVLTVNPPSELTRNPDLPATIARGHHQFAILVGCAVAAAAIRAAFLPLDARLVRLTISARTRRTMRTAVIVLAVGVVGIAAVAGAASKTINDKIAQFQDGGGVAGGGFDRLLSTSSNGRLEHWRVAVATYDASPFHGAGAGTYEISWNERRHNGVNVLNAHSLYLETLAELGWSGMVLLGLALVAILVGFARRARGAERPLYAALFAAGLAWVIAAAVDWDWQMPAVTLWLFAAGGLALAAPRRERVRGRRVRQWLRVPAFAACVLLALAPLTVLREQGHENDAVDAATIGDCPTALREARAASDAAPTLAAPAVIETFCDVQLGHPRAAVAPLRQALSHDPDNWQLWYDLAVVRAAIGTSPKAATLTTYRLNRIDPKVKDLAAVYAIAGPHKFGIPKPIPRPLVP